MFVGRLKLALLLVALAAPAAHAARFSPEKLRLPSVGMVGLDAAGAAAILSRQIAPPPVVGPAPVRKLKFVRTARGD
jgi:hypothetical protein